ncbi:DUF6708 domain-containing protein [Burkholderia cepacia]|uniref:DUF6708 domain-containing protein n=1 Tax=Burkholderia cepacia TaxID=292 RepID=UPI000AA1BA52|nr:DUF6708 domain-containing protein [Burkholderia cepacia]
MAMTWRFSRQTRIGVAPAIRDQLVSVDRDVLCLRNAWVADSVFMGRMYTVGNAIMFVFLVYMFFKLPLNSSKLPGFDLLIWTYIVGSAVFLSFFVALTWYRVFFIKRLSNFYFNRKTRKVYYQRNKTLIAFDWAQTEGAEFVRNEFGGRSFSTNFALAFGPRPAPGDEQDRTVLWVDSNAPNDPDPRYIAEVWEYICQFMEKGPDHLPPPGEPNWWYVPLHRICLTPAEAWRHYAPWRSGEPGEWQGGAAP